jgi:cobalt-zinc-cadmium efflux system membrane fusion protein
MNKYYLYNFILISVLLSCCKVKTETKVTKKEPIISDSMAKMITIDTVKLDYIQDQLTLSGEVANDENKVVKIFPNASGQVLSVNVSLGDRINKGQTLAVIKSADVAGNYADLKSANSDAAIAEKEYKNAEELYKNGISSEKEFIQAKLQYQKAITAVNKVHTQIAINGGGRTNAGGTYIITAPRSGYVVEKNITAGSFIRNDNGQNLFTISDMQDVWIWANVFETDIQKIKVGSPADITTLSYPDKVFHGRVDQINSVLDPSSKAMKAKIILPNPGMLLKPQMFTKIIINNKEDQQALVIPGTAIVFDGGKNYVLLYKDRYNIKAQEVQILKQIGDNAYIVSGLKEGDLVIGKNQVLIYNSLNGE